MINYCECGCGKTIVSHWNSKTKRMTRFKHGHNTTWLPPILRGSDNSGWRGGIHKSKRGYVYILMPDHPRATMGRGYVPEHVLIMEKHIGRYIRTDEVVHHKNKKRWDNRIENLQLLTGNKEHRHIHSEERRKEEISNRVCNMCNTHKTIYIQNYSQWYKDKINPGWLCYNCIRKQKRSLRNA